MTAVPEVVVTGIGVLAPGCCGRLQLWAHLVNGRSQLQLAPDPSAPERCVPMGRLGGGARECLRSLPAEVQERWSREQQLHLASVLSALRDAGLAREDLPRDRAGIFDGTSRGNLEYVLERVQARSGGTQVRKRDLAVSPPGQAAPLAAVHLGLRGPALTVVATCASGAVAIGQALRSIQRREIDIAFATGHDVPLLPFVYEAYGAAGLLRTRGAADDWGLRPFTNAAGTAFGEGSVTVVLETRAGAQARGATPLAVLLDFAHGNAGVHPIRVDASGEVPARMLAALLAKARVSPDEIDFVVGHGNGTPMTYISEIGYMKRVFGTRAADVPLLSTKPIFGHMMGAASALDGAAAALMCFYGETFATQNVQRADVPDGIRHDAATPAGGVRHGLVVSYGMGGHIAALLLAQVDAPRAGRGIPGKQP